MRETLMMLAALTRAEEYLPLALQCRTENQFNLLHIQLENILSPGELTYFVELAETQQLPRQTCDWLRKIAGLSPGLFHSPQGFRRQALADNVLFYQDSGRDVSEKTLLVGFSGNARRLMMPISVFLQCLDSRLWDVVLFRKGSNQGSYLKEGVEGLASNLPGVVQYVETAVSAKSYQRIMTLGTSGGGLPAILCAILMDAARGISIGGVSPQSLLDPWLEWQLSVHRTYATRRPELGYAYGANCEPDRASALSCQSTFGGRLHPITAVGDHNPLEGLLKSGRFSRFLNELLA